MESLFHNNGSKFIAHLRNNYGTYLAANAPFLVRPTGVESTSENTKWTITFKSATSEYTEFSICSIYNNELATKPENGQIHVYQVHPNPSRPFCWKTDNSQLPSGGFYLLCDGESRDGILCYHHLSATREGTIGVKPRSHDSMLDPGCRWFIEVVEKNVPETGRVTKQLAPVIGRNSSVSYQPSGSHQQLGDINQQPSLLSTYKVSSPGFTYKWVVGMNSNGSGNQNIGDVVITDTLSVNNAGFGMRPNYNEGPSRGLGTISSVMQDGQHQHNSEQSPIPSNRNLGEGTHFTAWMTPLGAPSISTININAGNNSNGSGTQINNFTINK